MTKKDQDTVSDELLSRKQAAAYLGFSVQTLAVWACYCPQRLPHFKLGHLARYRKRDLDEFIERMAVKEVA
jgi:hypothetical protein